MLITDQTKKFGYLKFYFYYCKFLALISSDQRIRHQARGDHNLRLRLGAGEGLLFVRPVAEAGTDETSTASAADRCAATELTGYSRTRAIERRGDPIK